MLKSCHERSPYRYIVKPIEYCLIVKLDALMSRGKRIILFIGCQLRSYLWVRFIFLHGLSTKLDISLQENPSQAHNCRAVQKNEPHPLSLYRTRKNRLRPIAPSLSVDRKMQGGKERVVKPALCFQVMYMLDSTLLRSICYPGPFSQYPG